MRTYYYQVSYKYGRLTDFFYTKAQSAKDAKLDCLVRRGATDINYILRIGKQVYDKAHPTKKSTGEGNHNLRKMIKQPK